MHKKERIKKARNFLATQHALTELLKYLTSFVSGLLLGGGIVFLRQGKDVWGIVLLSLALVNMILAAYRFVHALHPKR